MSLLPELKPNNQDSGQTSDMRPDWIQQQEGKLVRGSLDISIAQLKETLPSDAEKIFYTRVGEMLDRQESDTTTQPAEPTIPDDVRQELETAAHTVNNLAEQTNTQKWRLFPENPKKKIKKLIKFLRNY